MTSINATISTNPFGNIWKKMTNLVSPSSEQNKVAELSQAQLVSAIKNDLAAKLDQKKVTVSGNTVKQLQKESLKFLTGKAEVTEDEVAAECQLQSELIKGRKSYIEIKATMLFSRIYPEAVNFIHHIFDTAFKVLGIYELGQENGDIKDATNRLTVYLQIIAYPAIILAAFMAVLPAALAVIATATVLAAALVGVGIYIQYYKPCPNTLKGFMNLTIDAQRGRIAPVLGRTQEINQVVARLKNREAVLLLGESGVGKTEIVKGIAHQAMTGQIPELKGKRVFYVNATQLVGLKAAEFVTKTMKQLTGYENEAVLFIDEVQALWANIGNGATTDSKSLAAQNIKSLIDRIPLCIFATTPKEFKEYGVGNDAAICRRLGIDQDGTNAIVVKAMDHSQIEMVLINHLQTIAPDIEVRREIIAHTLNKIEGRPQPFTAKKVFTDAAARLLKDPKSTLTKKLQDVELQIENTKASYLQGRDVQEVAKELKNLQESQAEIKKQIKDQTAKIDQVKRINKAWLEAREEMLTTADKIRATLENGKKCDALQKKWVVYSEFVLPALRALKEDLSKSKELEGIKTSIDQELIDQVIAEKIA